MRKINLSAPSSGLKLQFLSLTVLLALLITSCKKESGEPVAVQNPVDEQLISKITSWLDDQKKDLSTNASIKIDSLKAGLDYYGLHMEKYRDDDMFIVVPVSDRYKSQNNQDKNSENYLVMVLRNQDSIIRGNIIQYISATEQRTLPQNTFYKIFTYQDLDYSGRFIMLSVIDDFRYELKFENQKLVSVSDLKKKAASTNGSGKLNECIDWYEQTWYVWSDGTMQLISEIYLYTDCDGDCWQAKLINARSYRINCSGGNGGGNGIEYEYAVTADKYWEVYRENAGPPDFFVAVKAHTQFWGKKVANEQQGGHFTGAVSQGTYTMNFSSYGMDFQKLGDYAYHYSGQHAYHKVSGNVIYPPNTIPPYYIDKTETFRFDQIFP